jgi:argininosuccinate lyase
MSESKKLWGGRFSGETDPGFARFNRSFGFDRRLFEADVRGSLAHCEGLRAAGVLGVEEAAAITSGLRELLARAEREGEAFFKDDAAEDVHSFIESRLVPRLWATRAEGCTRAAAATIRSRRRFGSGCATR